MDQIGRQELVTRTLLILLLANLSSNIYSKTRFNLTRRRLKEVIILIPKKMTSLFYSYARTTFIVDSMLIPVCNFRRSYPISVLRHLAEYGYCASKKNYYDFKLQALTDLNGYIYRFCIISAKVYLVNLNKNKILILLLLNGIIPNYLYQNTL